MSDELLLDLNHTELYQMARAAGLIVSPATSKEELIKYVLNEEEPPDKPNEVDCWRHGIMGFLIHYWRVVETQLACPAKTKDPKACFNCIDQQVVSCLVQNHSALHEIRLFKKEK